MKFDSSLNTMIKTDLAIGVTPALLGEPGIGKSSFFEDVAKELGTEVFVLPCNTLADKADLTAPRLIPTPDGKSHSQVFYPHEVVQSAIEYARANPREQPVLFLDEINRSNSDITSSVLTLVTLRKIGKESLPDNLRLAVAGNDRGNVTTLDEASLSRFALYHVEPDAHTFMQVVGDSLNPWIKSVLDQHPNFIFMKSEATALAQDGDDDDDDPTAKVADIFDGGEEMLQITTPRTIEYLSKFLNAVSEDDLRTWSMTQSSIPGTGDSRREVSLLQEVIEGKVGITPFAYSVVERITTHLMSATAPTGPAQATVPKPTSYDLLKNLGTQQEIDDFISTFTPKERGANLVYALYEQKDNARWIVALASAFGVGADGVPEGLTTDQNALVMSLAQAKTLDGENVEALVNTNAPFVANLATMFSMVGLI